MNTINIAKKKGNMMENKSELNDLNIVNQKEVSENPLAYENINRLLYKFSIPAIIGMTVNALYNVVDRMFIGNADYLGAKGLAAITISFPAMIIMMSIGILFGVGGATLFSLSLGRGHVNKAEKILGNVISLSLISGLIITIIGSLFLDDLLKLFGASQSILPYAREYMRIIFLGTVFQVTGMGLNNLLRADGKPKLSMTTMFIGAGTNIILDPIFIYILKMGMAGAALATIISQLISVIWAIQPFLSKSAKHRLRLINMKLNSNLAKEIIVLGMPGFILQLANSLLNMLLNNSLASYGGDIAVSTMGIINSVLTLLILPIIGLNQGLQPIVSFNFGARQYNRVKEAVKKAIIAGVVFSSFGFLIVQIFPQVLVGIFNRDPELLRFGSHAIRIWLMCLPVVGFQIIGANFFQAIGESKKAMFLTTTRQVLFLMPSIIIFAKIWGLNGILFAAPFADALAASITFAFFYKFIKKLNEGEVIPEKIEY